MIRRATFLRRANRDINQIAEWVAEEARSRRVGEEFAARLRARCHHLATLPGTLGASRDELGADLRGVPWRGYLILFRYLDDRLQVVRILHGMRDLPNLVTQEPES